MSPPHILPIYSAQSDFEVSVDDVRDGMVAEETFWLSSYQAGEDSIHGKVQVSLNERDRNIVDYQGTGGVSFREGAERHTYLAACDARGVSYTKLVGPDQTFSDPLPRISKDLHQKISAFDVAPDGSQFTTGYNDGSVYIISTSTTANHSIARRCHVASITSLHFFPSSRVLLTASLDFSLSILPADPPQPSTEPTRLTPVRILKGHSRSVTSAAIISRGRTVLSSSRDATLRLWDVSSGTQIRMMGSKNFVPIQAISTGERGEAVFTRPPHGEETGVPLAIDPREVDTADKVVYCALSNGSFEIFDLGTKLSVFHSPAPSSSSALESICYSSTQNLLATGALDGVVSVYDTRSLSTPLMQFKRNGASIEDLAFMSSSATGREPEVGLAIATQDGLPYVASIKPEGPSVRAELIGVDCDAVRSVRVGSAEGEVWTAGDDGIVRRYSGPGLATSS